MANKYNSLEDLKKDGYGFDTVNNTLDKILRRIYRSEINIMKKLNQHPTTNYYNWLINNKFVVKQRDVGDRGDSL